VPHLHEREAQQVEALPWVGIVHPLVVQGQTDAPHPVHRTGFDKDAVTRSGPRQAAAPCGA
jgi:hypothetical protein